MARQTRVFYAYPSEPRSVDEVIRSAIADLKTDREILRGNVRFRAWPDLLVSGKRLAATVFQNIDRSHIFACDLTYPNRNVSFELGYAVAGFKRVFPSLDISVDGVPRRYWALYSTLLGIGYSEYQNHTDLAAAFKKESPWKDLESTLLGERYRSPFARQERPTLLYVKPSISPESVIATEEALRSSIFGHSLFVDDPKDNPSPSLEWYADQILAADSIIVHLLGDHQAGNYSHNIKASVVAGLAYGFNRPVVMLVQSPYVPPLDYEHLLNVHVTAADCVSFVSQWLEDVGKDIPRRRPRRPGTNGKPTVGLDVRALSLGQHVAELERFSLNDYFVETSAYYQALQGPTTILIGRRGAGKTAILYGIQAELARDRRNHTTILKPVGYETHGLIRVFEEIRHLAERGYLIESLWKYLIYSEIAASVEQTIGDKPSHQPMTGAESEFLEYCERNANLVRAPFSERMKSAMESLEGIGVISNAREQRARISEGLHGTLIRELRRHLGLVLADTPTLTLLIDGLDDPWAPGEHVTHLSDLISGLLRVAGDIPDDFRRSDSRLDPVDVRVTVLLRSDIFAFIQPLVVEQDKLPIERVIWNDPDLLLRVLDERLVQGAPDGHSANDVWAEMFPSEVTGLPCKSFILNTVLPRPRDLIYFVREATNIAINRGHKQISQEDLLTARERYSAWVFEAILKEDDPRREKLESVLYEFAGADRRLSTKDIEQLMASINVEGNDLEFYIDLLCDIGFLGIKTNIGYSLSRHEGERQTMREVARRLDSDQEGAEEFEINPAFYWILQIE